MRRAAATLLATVALSASVPVPVRAEAEEWKIWKASSVAVPPNSKCGEECLFEAPVAAASPPDPDAEPELLIHIHCDREAPR